MPPSSIPSELLSRVDQWAQEVVRCAEQHSQGGTRSSCNGMKFVLYQPVVVMQRSSSIHTRETTNRLPLLDGTNKAGAEKKAVMNSETPKQRAPGSKNIAKEVNDDDDEEYNPLALPSRSLPSSIPELPPPGSSANPSSVFLQLCEPAQENRTHSGLCPPIEA